MIFELTAVVDELIENNIKKIVQDLSVFYNTNLESGLPRVFILKDRKTFNAFIGKNSESYQVGFCMDKDIYILDRHRFSTESSHAIPSTEDYLRILKHETSHLYFASISKNNYNPRWLWEGVALYTDGSLHKMIKKPKLYKGFLKYYDSTDIDIYSESGFIVEFLIEEFGKDLLLKMIKGLSIAKSEDEFNKLFRSIYGFSLSYHSINEHKAC